MSFIKFRVSDFNSRYKKHFKLSLIFSLLLLILLFKFAPDQTEKIVIKEDKPDIINIDDIIPTKQNIVTPPKHKPPIPVFDNTEDIVDIEFNTTEINYDVDLVEAPPMYKPKIVEGTEDKVFVVVEDMPELIGGIGSIQSKVQYTEIARRVGIEGQVVIKVIVDENGDVLHAEVIKKLFDDLDRISIEAAKQLKFKPGRQRGKPVKVQVHIPITFKLK